MARMLRRALIEAGSDPWVADLGIERRDNATPSRRARFAIRILMGSVLRRADWMLFNHVGVARAHAALPRRVRTPYGVFVHDIEAWDPGLDSERLRTLADAAVIIANSGYTARRVEAAHGGLVRPVACPLGLMEPARESGPRDETLLASCGPASVLIVGRIMRDERYKGHDQLLDAWPHVRSIVSDARLIVAGWGDDVERLREKAAALGVADAVTFTGYVNGATLAALFERAATYAMPSAREGFGLVYLEAMRNGLPCVGSTLDAAREVIVHGESGLVVDRSNPRELAEALTVLLSNPDLREKMGAAGRRRFEANFTFAHFRDRLLPILEAAFPGFAARNISGMEPTNAAHDGPRFAKQMTARAPRPGSGRR